MVMRGPRGGKGTSYDERTTLVGEGNPREHV